MFKLTLGLNYFGLAECGQLGFIDSISGSFEAIILLHNDIMGLLVYVLFSVLCFSFFITLQSHDIFNLSFINFERSVKFKKGSSKELVVVENFWTIVPTLFILMIVLPSVGSLCFFDSKNFAWRDSLIMKVTGRQWYWHFECNSILQLQESFNANKTLLYSSTNFFRGSLLRYLQYVNITAGFKPFWFGYDDEAAVFCMGYQHPYPRAMRIDWVDTLTKALVVPGRGELRFDGDRWLGLGVFHSQEVNPFWAVALINKMNFDSYMVETDELLPGLPRLLLVKNFFFSPYGIPCKILLTADDVIHSWVLTNLGAKMDAVPNRTNIVSYLINRCGIHYGQCSELCGINHAYMPITSLCLYAFNLYYVDFDETEEVTTLFKIIQEKSFFIRSLTNSLFNFIIFETIAKEYVIKF